jgi:hypothetical protein
MKMTAFSTLMSIAMMTLLMIPLRAAAQDTESQKNPHVRYTVKVRARWAERLALATASTTEVG